MDLSPSRAEAAFRTDIRSWLQEHLPWEYGKGLPPAVRRPGRRGRLRPGLAGPAGRRPLGGRDVARGLRRTRGRARPSTSSSKRSWPAPGPPRLVGRIGVNLAGPTLLAHGTEEQRRRWLPGILSADELWCQLFSEPGAGSDLAGVTTRATPVDGGWVLDGQKVWTSYAQFADWGVCLARSDPDAPKHRGSPTWWWTCTPPGSRCGRWCSSTGEAEFNEVFLDGVFVPADRLIGAEHDGWTVANSTLSHERGTNPRQLVIHIQLLEELLALAAEGGAFDDVRLRQRLAQAYVEVRIFQLHNLRSVSRLAKGLDPGPEGSALKLYWSEMSKRMHETAMAVLGEAAPLWKGARHDRRRREVAAVVALLPGVVGVGRDQRDPADHTGRAGPRASPEPARRPGRRPATAADGRTRRRGRRCPTMIPWCCTRCVAMWPRSP